MRVAAFPFGVDFVSSQSLNLPPLQGGIEGGLDSDDLRLSIRRETSPYPLLVKEGGTKHTTRNAPVSGRWGVLCPIAIGRISQRDPTQSDIAASMSRRVVSSETGDNHARSSMSASRCVV